MTAGVRPGYRGAHAGSSRGLEHRSRPLVHYFVALVLAIYLVIEMAVNSEATGSQVALAVVSAIAVLGFSGAAAIWWMYFGHELALERTASGVRVFAYAHIPLYAALTAIGAGIALAIEHSSDSGLDAGTRWALAGGAAVYLVCLTVAQRRLALRFLALTAQSRAVGAGLLVAFAAFGGELEPVTFTALATGVLVGLVAFKLWSMHRAGLADEVEETPLGSEVIRP